MQCALSAMDMDIPDNNETNGGKDDISRNTHATFNSAIATAVAIAIAIVSQSVRMGKCTYVSLV